MTGSLRHAVGRRLPWGLLGMLASVLFAECWFARNDIHFLGPETASWRLGPRSARERAPAAEVLCFGDSLVKLGVVPKVMERTLNRRVYNLALIAGQPPATFFLLRTALEAGAKPSALIVDYEPHLLSLPPQEKAPLWSELAGARDCLRTVLDDARGVLLRCRDAGSLPPLGPIPLGNPQRPAATACEVPPRRSGRKSPHTGGTGMETRAP